MKKIFSCLLLSALLLPVFTSCDKDSEGLTKITTYAIIDLTDGDVVTTPIGQPFTDPGFVAMQGTEDVSANVTVSGNVNTNKCGFYTLKYNVINDDGFPASATRTVVVVDPNNFASAYLASCAYGTRSYRNLHIMITDNGDGTYNIDDMAGGLYCQGRYPGYEAYGYDFWYDETLKLEGNTISLASGEMGDGSNWYWGEPLDVLDGTYDPTTGTITYKAAFSGNAADAIQVTLTK